jgi:hypothetical protein
MPNDTTRKQHDRSVKSVFSQPKVSGKRPGDRARTLEETPESGSEVKTELLIARADTAQVLETYGQSRAERRLRKFKPKLVNDMLRRKAAGSYESASDGWTPM